MLRIAHRGASGQYPENTMLAFSRALEMGADAFELDVHICKTGEPVIIHDAKLDRTTSGKGYVKDKTLTELKTLDAGKGQHIPTLAELLDWLNKRAVLFIELKSPDSAQPVARLITEYVKHKGWAYKQFIVLSFNHGLLSEVAQYNPQISLCASVEKMPPDLAACADRIGAKITAPSINYLTPEFMEDARARGLKVYAWTANTSSQIAKAKALGVDGIMTDYLDRL